MRKLAQTTVVFSIVAALMWAGAKSQLFTFGDRTATAQSNAADLSARNLESIFKELATAAIDQRIPPRDYRIKVEVRGPTKLRKSARTPYLPDTQSIEYLRTRRIEELRSFAPRIAVQVWLDASYAESSFGEVQEILREALKLKSPTDEIQVVGSKIRRQVEKAEPIPNNDNPQDRAELNSLKRELRTIERERNDSKSELLQAKSELDRLAREMLGLKALADGEKEQAALSLKDLVRKHAGLFVLGALFFISSVVVGILIYIFASAVRSSYRTLGSAIESVSGAISQIATANQRPSEGVFKLDGSELPGTEADAQQPMRLPIEEAYNRLDILKSDIGALVSSNADGPILNFLNQQLNNPQTAIRAVLALEILGTEHAGRYFQQLNSSRQDLIREATGGARFTKPKIEMMLECAEEIKTRLVMQHTRKLNTKASDSVASQLSMLADEDFPRLLATLEDRLAMRLLVHFDPDTMAKSLQTLFHRNAARFGEISRLMPELTAIYDQPDLDDQLVKHLDRYLSSKNSKRLETFVPVYRKVLASLDEPSAEQLLAGLSSNAELANRLRGVIVTFRNLFEVSDDIFVEVTGSLQVKQLAALVASSPENAAQRLMKGLNEVKRQLVIDEVERLRAAGAQRVEQAAQAARAVVTQKLRPILSAQSEAREMTSGDNGDANQGGGSIKNAA